MPADVARQHALGVDEERLRHRSTWFHFQPAACLMLLIVAECLCVGCGNNVARVNGVVTVDGEPLRSVDGVRATIFFQPASGQGPTGAAVVDEQGEYQLYCGSQKGVPPGPYLVTISASQVVESELEHGTPTGRRITAPHYADVRTSGLRFDLESGNNRCDIDLETASP